MVDGSAMPVELVRQLELLRLNARRRFLGDRQGVHRSIRRGHGLEFSDYRHYEPGDNPRHIDWGVYGRTDRLYVKRFLEEENLHVVVLLDGSASMKGMDDSIKWRFSQLCALSAAYVALMQHDPTTVALLGGRVTPKLQALHGISIINSIISAESARTIDLLEEIRKVAVSIRLPGLVFLVSDLLYPPQVIDAGLDLLRARNIDLSILHVLGSRDVAPLETGTSATVVDSETGEEASLVYSEELETQYKQALQQHLDIIQKRCQETGTNYSVAYPQTSAPGEVVSALAKTRLFQ